MIAAIVLAAGLSRRMGRPKMVLPWGNSTVIGTVINTLQAGGLSGIWVVTGGAQDEVKQALQKSGVQFVYNPDHQNGEMLDSVKVGLEAISTDFDATLLVLGDQPQIQADTVDKVIVEYQRSQARLIVPSYQMRRGHPWLIHRSLWAEILEMKSPSTMRDLLIRHDQEIRYLVVETSTILQDLDTMEDYQRDQPPRS